MTTNRTYRHNDAEGNFIGWRTEVKADQFSSQSREATLEEIGATEAAEARAAQIAAFTATLDAPATDPAVEVAAADLAAKAAQDKANEAAQAAAAKVTTKAK